MNKFIEALIIFLGFYAIIQILVYLITEIFFK